MITLLVIIWCLLVALLVITIGIYPERSTHSWFELHRRGDTQAIKREKQISAIVGLKVFCGCIFLASAALISEAVWSFWGIAAILMIWIITMYLSRLRFISQLSKQLYIRLEPSILRLYAKYPLLVKLFSAYEWRPRDVRIESEEHLEHLVQTAESVLSAEQKIMILNGLTWHRTEVSEVMTPKKKIVTVPESELLGPLVLDDLHRTGHDLFPVVNDAGEIVGILDITQVLDITTGKHSETAGRVMNNNVVYIAQSELLPAALRLFRSSRQPLIIVRNSKGSMIGLITLSDITNMFDAEE